MSVDEVEVEDLNNPPNEMEFRKGNAPDAPLTMQMRRRYQNRTTTVKTRKSLILRLMINAGLACLVQPRMRMTCMKKKTWIRLQ